jgi:hypothetical protein
MIRLDIIHSPSEPILEWSYSHELTLTIGVEVFDPYITIQADGIHTMSRRMDNETENKQEPPS